MGAMAWVYEISCPGSVDEGLQKLYQQILESDELVNLIGPPAEVAEFGRDLVLSMPLDDMLGDGASELMLAEIERTEVENRFVSRNSVLMLCMERMGTGTALDVEEAPECPDSVVVGFTGSSTPDEATIRANQGDFDYMAIDRGEAVHVRASDSDVLFFFGITAD